MAGSYKHVVAPDGQLLVNEQLQGMLECCSGDVYEAVQEMYGMIWWLADQNTLGGRSADPIAWSKDEIVRLSGNKFPGLWVVISDKGTDRVNLAKLGGDGGKYLRVTRRSVSVVPVAEVVRDGVL